MIGWRNYPSGDAQSRQHANMPLAAQAATNAHKLIPRLLVPSANRAAARALYGFDEPDDADYLLDLHLQQVIEAINERRAYMANPANGVQHYGISDEAWAAGWAPYQLTASNAPPHSLEIIDILRDLLWNDTIYAIGKWLGGTTASGFRLPFASETEMLNEAASQSEDTPAAGAVGPTDSGKYTTIPARCAEFSAATHHRRMEDIGTGYGSSVIPMCREHIDALYAVLNTLDGYVFQILPMTQLYTSTAIEKRWGSENQGYLVYSDMHAAAVADMTPVGSEYNGFPSYNKRGLHAGGEEYHGDPPVLTKFSYGEAQLTYEISSFDANWQATVEVTMASATGDQVAREQMNVTALENMDAIAINLFYQEDDFMVANINARAVAIFRPLAANQFTYKW